MLRTMPHIRRRWGILSHLRLHGQKLIQLVTLDSGATRPHSATTPETIRAEDGAAGRLTEVMPTVLGKQSARCRNLRIEVTL